MNTRILLILKTKNISASKFADEIGVQRSSISHILSGRNNPSLDFVQKTLQRFPDISPDWILTGKGSMYLQPDLFSAGSDSKIENVIHDEALDQLDLTNSSRMEQDEEIKESGRITKQIRPKVEKISETQNESFENKISEAFLKTPEKKIERIIIFYTDKTCLQYTPE